MYNFVLIKNEIKTLFRQKIILASTLLVNTFMVFGINSINNSNNMAMHGIKKTSTTIAFGSSQYGAMLGVFLYSILTILILSKDKRKNSLEIVSISINYFKLTILRMVSMIGIALITTLSGLIIILGIQRFIFNISIEFPVYVYTYSVILFIPILLSILMSSGLFMISDSLDISILSMGALYSIGTFSSNYLLLWVKPPIPVFSDFAGIQPAGKLILYNRLAWVYISISILLVGLLCRRRYSLDFFKSLKINIRCTFIPVLLAVSILCLGFVIDKEPYMNRYNRLLTEEEEITLGIELNKINPQVTFYPEKGKMRAKVSYEFDNKAKGDYIKFSTNEGLKINEVKVNSKVTGFKRKNESNIIYINIPKSDNILIEISYEGSIKYDGAMGYAGYICKDSIYLLECSNWIFRPLTETSPMIESTGYFKAPKELCIVTPGKLTDVIEEEEYRKWQYALKSPSIDLAVFAGKYTKKELISGSTSIEFYYSPRHEKYIEHRDMEGYIKNIMNYYSKHFGEYSLDKYPLKIVETSVYKPGGHSSINVVTFAEYMLNREIIKRPLIQESSSEKDIDRFLENDFTLHHDIEIIAHEIAHQWWGSGVDAINETPWSNEGLANYSAYKYIESEFGENAAKTIYFLWEDSVNRVSNSYYIKHPENIEKLNKTYRMGIEMENEHMQLYHKMPLQLIKGEMYLKEKQFLNNLSKIYTNHLFEKLNYDDFLKEMHLTKEVISFE